MNLYEELFGKHPLMPMFLALLVGRNFGRLRDAWLERTEDGEFRIAVYTRNGGPNRAEHMPEFNDDPLYLYDKDDEFDPTYATIYFRLPKNANDILNQRGAPDGFDIEEYAMEPIDMSEAWKAAISSIGN